MFSILIKFIQKHHNQYIHFLETASISDRIVVGMSVGTVTFFGLMWCAGTVRNYRDAANDKN